MSAIGSALVNAVTVNGTVYAEDLSSTAPCLVEQDQLIFAEIGRDIRSIKRRLAALVDRTLVVDPTIWPITPVQLSPPDTAQDLPAWAALSSPATDLSTYAPVDLRLACLDYNFFDFQLNQSMDLVTDDSLDTALLISLFTDRYDPTIDKGGWWGDGYSDAEQVFGSRLWTLALHKVNTQTLRDAESYSKEALQWLLDDGLLTHLNVACSWHRREQSSYRLQVAVSAIYQKGSHYRSALNRQYLL